MNKFTFVLSDGQTFEVTGPAGSTQAQAERIFLEQTAAGALVGLRPGDTRVNPETTIIKFQLSREDRGAAGVDNLPVLAINSQGSISRLPDLNTISVENGITQSDFLTGPSVSNSIGLLSSTVIQGLLAQTIKNVNQPADQISQEKGIGQYGFNALQLEAAGYLKPGTSALFLDYPNNTDAWQLPNPDNFVDVMSSDGIWTGLGGINTLYDLLNNADIQDQIAYNQLSNSYYDLITSGLVEPPIVGSSQIPTAEIQTSLGVLPYGLVGNGGITGLLNSGFINASQLITASGQIVNIAGSIGNLNVGAQLAGMVQGAAQFGVNTVAGWVNNTVGLPIKVAVNEISRLGQYASQFSNLKLPGSLDLGNLSNQAVAGIGNLTTQAFGEIKGLATQALGGIGTQLSGLTSGLTSQFSSGLSGLNFLSGLSLPAFSIFGGINFNKSTPMDAPAFTNTVNRQTLDVATNQVIGSSKILLPDFGTSTLSQNLLGPIVQAQQTLNSIRNLGGTLQRLG